MAQNNGVRDDVSESAESILGLARLDLATYSTAVYPNFECPAHLSLIANRLESLERGECRRLLVVAPPRSGKSLLCVQMFAAYWLGKRPTESIIVATHGEELAASFGRSIRNVMTGDVHRAIFPESRLAADLTAAHRFALTRGGSLRCVGKGSGLVGHGANLVIADDLCRDSEEAHSDVQQRSTWSWFTEVLMTRLQPHGCVVLTGVRWSQGDLLGRLMEEYANEWTVVRLPALSEGPELDLLGRDEGTPLWEERFNRDALESMRRQLGSVAFNALYQANPQPAEGSLFKAGWFPTYTPQPRDSYLRIILSLDCASKTATTNDYSAGLVIGETENAFHVLHGWRAKLEFGALRSAILELAEMWKPDVILIEDAAAGTALIQEFNERTSLPVVGIRPISAKTNRAMTCLGVVEAGRVRLPEHASWKEDFLSELCSFPNGKWDDWTDSLTQGVRYAVDQPIPGIFVF
jgi:phage uncharacterized protein (putative large terminase), C-terminal domain